MFRIIKFAAAAWGIMLCTSVASWALEPVDQQALLAEVKALRAELAQMDVVKKKLHALERKLVAAGVQAETTDQNSAVVTDTAQINDIVKEVLQAERPIKIGGAMRINYGYKDWDESQEDKYGDFGFNLFRLNVDGSINDWILSAEYRFYSYMNTIHHGYIGYNVNDEWQLQLGIQQVPFGLQPYASHNYWSSGAYYIGFEDDYDLGVKALYSEGPWSLALAFYKNDELANAGSTDRYSIDVINTDADGYAGAQADGNEETNQFNVRLAYCFDHGDSGTTEVGVSGEWGQLYNTITDDTGSHWATGLHMNGNYGRWNVQLEYAAYEYDPENPQGLDDDIITMGAFGYAWGAPAQAQIGIANVAYTIPVSVKWLDSVTFYSDNTVIKPTENDQPTSWQNVAGALLASGPIYFYLDIISAENMIFSNGNMVDESDRNNDERTTRFNMNVGYYW